MNLSFQSNEKSTSTLKIEVFTLCCEITISNFIVDVVSLYLRKSRFSIYGYIPRILPSDLTAKGEVDPFHRFWSGTAQDAVYYEGCAGIFELPLCLLAAAQHSQPRVLGWTPCLQHALDTLAHGCIKDPYPSHGGPPRINGISPAHDDESHHLRSRRNNESRQPAAPLLPLWMDGHRHVPSDQLLCSRGHGTLRSRCSVETGFYTCVRSAHPSVQRHQSRRPCHLAPRCHRTQKPVKAGGAVSCAVYGHEDTEERTFPTGFEVCENVGSAERRRHCSYVCQSREIERSVGGGNGKQWGEA